MEDRLEDAPALLLVRQRDEDLEVETARTQDRVVHQVDPVGRAHDQHLVVGVKPVHLAQKLVDGCGGFVGVPEMVEPAAQRVDLVDEDDAAVLAAPGTRKQLPDPLGADAHEHLLELGGDDLDEAAAGLVGQRPRKQRLPRPRRTVKHNPPSDPRAHLLVPLRIVEKVNHLLELLLDLLAAVVIVETGAASVDVGLVLNRRDVGLVHLPYQVLECGERDNGGGSDGDELIADEFPLVLEGDVIGSALLGVYMRLL